MKVKRHDYNALVIEDFPMGIGDSGSGVATEVMYHRGVEDRKEEM